MFRVSFFGSIGEIVLIMCQELIKLLSRINPIDAECSWTRRRELVEHVNELIAIEFEVLSALNKSLTNGLVQTFVLLVPKTLHRVHQLCRGGCTDLIEGSLHQQSVETG